MTQEKEQQEKTTEGAAEPDVEKMRSALAEGLDEDLPDIDKAEEGESTEETSQEATEETTEESAEEGAEETTEEGKEESTEETPDTTEEGEQQKTEEQPEEGTEEGTEEKEGVSELKTQPIWDKIKTEYEGQFGEGSFEMPEGVTAETEYDSLIDFVRTNTTPDFSQFPEEAQEIIKLHQEGKYDPERYFSEKTVQSTDITKLSDRDLLFNLYKARDGKSEANPDGFTDEEIEDHLDKKTKLELRDIAQSARRSVTEAREQKRKQQETQEREKYAKAFEKMEQTRKDQAQKVVNRFSKRRNIFGVEFSQEDKQKFDKEFLDMVAINKETGTTRIAEMLNDDNVLYSVAALLWKGDLSGYITEIKEGVKKNIEKKLDRSLDKGKGSTKTAKLVDRSKLV